jgi:superfamily II DNA or RNA helicase
LSSIKTKAGDYDTRETEAVMDRPTITGDAIRAYRQYADGKRCMVFCVSIAHSEHTCAQYNAAGIPAEHIDGTYTDKEREGALERFRAGQTLVLCTVQLAIEGLDIPAVEAVQQLRPTQSVIVYLQLIGRGLRVEDNKRELVILDQVNNWKRHGLPDDVREWSLDGRKKRKRSSQDDEPELQIQQCKECFHIFRKGVSECPHCGAEIEVTGRKIQQVDGQLAEVDIDAVRRERGREQAKARGLVDLVSVGVSRGMKNPAAWAAFVNASREGRKPTPSEFKMAGVIYERITNPSSNTAGSF